MRRLTNRAHFAVGINAAAVAGACCGAIQPEERPNIVLILADDLGYNDVGFHGCKEIPTPHLDRLAASGVQFSSGYVTHAYCSPSRAALLTGRYQQRFGHECNPMFDPDDETQGLPVGELTIADVLKSAGYVTGLVGKWHLGDAKPFHPNCRGFDYFFGFSGGEHCYFGETLPWSGILQRNGVPVPKEDVTYLTDDFAQECQEFIRRNRRNPFFLFASFTAPHVPDQATPRYLRRVEHLEGDRRMYAALICGLDDAVGRIVDELDRLDLSENTLIFFLSDNGGRHDGSDNRPFRGHKGRNYEGGVRVPFVASWPGRIRPDQVIDYPVSALDIAATSFAIAGAVHPYPEKMDGVNLMPWLDGKRTDAPHEALFWRVSGGWDWAVRRGNDKLCSPGWTDELELYDLKTDAGELRDLSAAKPETAAELKAAYERWNAENVAPLWMDPHKENVMKERKAAGLDH
jgi:arylsulfatase A-like enzyme